MDHSAVVTTNPSGFGQPVHVQCSCNTAGDFPNVQVASDWIIFQHFSKLGDTDTYSLSSGDPSDLPLHSAPTKTSASALDSPPESEAGVEKETLGAA
jgi:hypothetical protein